MRLSFILSNLINIYFYLIIVKCFLSWIPNINRENKFIKFINLVVEPYLEPFKRLIPPFGGIDASPIIAGLFLIYIIGYIPTALYRMGL